ncbi:MAG: bifunctional hydroxymethylpyrimidine kinase/phosphomethylpyrimidine kinase [Rikenellaceae bacterium]
MQYKRVLTIAGSDSGGGAGIQADIKSISACGCYAASAITAITAQNTLGVSEVYALPTEVIEAQIEAVMSDIGADAIKIGMMHSAEVVEMVCRAIDRWQPRHVIVDPVMVSTSGHRLIEESAIEMLRCELLPRATVITPNIPEAEILVGHAISSQAELPAAARELTFEGRVAVLLKAGHLSEEMLTDIFLDGEGQMHELSSPRIYSRNTHGTGCSLSSALAAFYALGYAPSSAARAAKEYLTAALLSGAQYEIGGGHGPVDHMYALR